MDQEELGHHHPEACVLVGSMTNFPHPNVQPSGTASGLNIHHVSEQYNNALYYGMMPYNGVEHHPAANFYHPYMTPAPGNPVLSASYFGSEPSSSYTSQGVIGIPMNEYGRSSHPMDATRACKRKDAEGIQGNFHLFGASTGPSSSLATSNTRQFEPRDGMMDSECFVQTHNRANEPAVSVEGGSRRAVRNRLGPGQDSALAHNQSFMLPGTYISQPYHPAGSPWLEQQIVGNRVDGSTSPWIHAPAAPYLHGSNVNEGSRENGIMSMLGYNETAGNRSANFLPPMQHRHHNVHHPTPPPLLQGPRNPNLGFYPPVTPVPYPVPPNNLARVTNNAHQDVANIGPRHLVPSGLRIYRPHRDGEATAEATLRPHLPYLRVLPTDEVAILEYPGYYETVNAVDHHQDMRLDIEDMSYEELLALGERIGHVNTGLSEETIRRLLQTRIHVSSAIPINLEEPACEEEETEESCIICQSEYKDQERVGILRCGHEYHADCLEKWLVVKNVCPICKSPALSTEKKNS